MSAAATMLEFPTFQALQRSATIDPKLVQQVKKATVDVTFKQVKRLAEQTRLAENEGRLDRAYVMISRCIHLCQLLVDHPGFSQFRNHPDGPVFRLLFEKSLNKYEDLSKAVQKLYAEQEAENRRPSPPPVRLPTPVEVLRDPVDQEAFGNFIKPTQLVASVEKFGKRALVLDYRFKQQPGIAYVRVDAIRTAPIHYPLVNEGLMFQHLMMYGNTFTRMIFRNINDYDLIVLMGDELAARDCEPFKAQSMSRIMLDALTTTNYTQPLRRKPLLLRGGFPAWQNAYPQYVDEPEKENSFGDDFDKLLGQMKRDVFNFHYPELSSISFGEPRIDRMDPQRPPASISPPPSSGSTSPPVVRNIPIRVLPHEPQPPPAAAAATSRTNVSDEPAITTKEYEAAVAPTGRPVVDRSKKPLMEQNREKESTEFPVAFDGAPIAAGRNRQFGSKHLNPHHHQIIPTLGGARPDVPPANQPAPSQAARPPTVPPRLQPKTVIPPETVNKYFANVQRVFDYTRDDVQKHSEVAPGGRAIPGLRNPANTCFMNCTLQALFHSSQMTDIFLKKKDGRPNFAHLLNPGSERGTRGAIVGSFAALMEEAWSGRYAWIDPNSFLRTFAALVNKEMGDGRQHDAREFLMALLDSMHEDMNRVNDNEQKPFQQDYDGTQMVAHAQDYEEKMERFSSSVIAGIFYLRTVSKIKCGGCKKASVTFEETPQLILEIPVDAPAPHLTHCLQRHYSMMPLDGMWKCVHCSAHSNALRSTETWKLPNVMIICLKRFAQRHGELVKNDIDVMIPDIVDMKPHLHPQSPEHKQETRYRRYAVTYHVGQLNGGHYTSRVLVPDAEVGARWLNFDDRTVTECSTPPNRFAFILYYSRVNSEPGRNY
ncbi:Ubiquitin carboxyl-terminal hydrolase [Aphelenchoides fujianensis]|nr:Ubiquitin carboxyl-terminal hydrolase [Aphelenchoides fujianensis]